MYAVIEFSAEDGSGALPGEIDEALAQDCPARQLWHTGADESVDISGRQPVGDVWSEYSRNQLVYPLIGRHCEVEQRRGVERAVGRRNVEIVTDASDQFAHQ